MVVLSFDFWFFGFCFVWRGWGEGFFKVMCIWGGVFVILNLWWCDVCVRCVYLVCVVGVEECDIGGLGRGKRNGDLGYDEFGCVLESFGW